MIRVLFIAAVFCGASYGVVCSGQSRGSAPHENRFVQARPEDCRVVAGPQDRILDAAARPFTGQGFAATSVVRVSDEIGSAWGAIYCYYRGKSDLFLAVQLPCS